LFFPVSASADNPQQVADAKAICACCLVRRECLAFALRTRQLHGIWGGMTEEERYPLVKAEHQAMDDNYKTPLIKEAIRMAARNLDLPEGAIFHSDRGSNYTSAELARELAGSGPGAA
jgi:hypothetical protein